MWYFLFAYGFVNISRKYFFVTCKPFLIKAVIVFLEVDSQEQIFLGKKNTFKEYRHFYSFSQVRLGNLLLSRRCMLLNKINVLRKKNTKLI